MTKRKTNPKGQLKLKLGINDERVPKLVGLLCIFLSIYLFIAFTSYLFTWYEDQDKVLRFSLGLLFDSQYDMANLLGRLGAIVSNMFFYWGFGLPSYLFVYLLGSYGILLIQRLPLSRNNAILRSGIIIMLVAAVFLEFVTGDAQFPWGGAFGSYMCDWLTKFLGTIGLGFLFLLLGIGLFVWIINPNFSEMTLGTAGADLKYAFEEWRMRKTTRRASDKSSYSSDDDHEDEEEAMDTVTTEAMSNAERIMQDDKKAIKVFLDEIPEDELKKGKQLSLDMDETSQRAKPEALRPGGDTDFEIDMPEPVDFANEGSSSSDMPPPVYEPIQEVQEYDPNNLEPYDPTLELSSYEHPVVALLEDYADDRVEFDRAELEANKDQIIETLLNYKIEIVKIRATIGPTVTLYEIVPAPGVRISKIKNLEDDIALSLAALGIRIIAPIPGRGTIGIEVPNKNKQIVSLKELLMSDKFKRAKMDLPIALGKTISNEVFVADLAKMPHLLIAGATGQGKSVGINAIILSLLYKKHPSQVKLVMIDPKKVELFPFSALENHFLSFLPGSDEPITTETSKVIYTLNSLCIEMDNRYNLLKKASARTIKEYNEKFVGRRLNPNKGHAYMPFIVLIIDEFADLIMTAGKEVELPIGRLAQLSRAVGIHLIIATQRPSVNIITGVIKANFPARIAYKVTSKVDSRTILDAGGADQLIGRGDMLLSIGGDNIRLQCAFVDTPEVERVIQFISQQKGYPEPHYLPEYHGDDDNSNQPGAVDLNDLDDLVHDAARLVVQNQHGSTSMIQRRLKLGYNRAGRIMDQLEALGIVGPAEGSKPREVLYYDEIELERYLNDKINRK